MRHIKTILRLRYLGGMGSRRAIARAVGDLARAHHTAQKIQS